MGKVELRSDIKNKFSGISKPIGGKWWGLGDFGVNSICSDNSHLYLAGYRYVSSPIDYICRVEKRRLFDAYLLDYGEYNPIVSGDVETLYSVRIDGSGVYLGGLIRESIGSAYKAIIQKRNLNNLSEILWTWTSYLAGTNREIFELYLDSNYVYGVGSQPFNTIRVKLQKSNGNQIWFFNDGGTQTYGSDGKDFLYGFKHLSGIRSIEKINLSTGAKTDHSYEGGTDQFIKGMILGDYAYIAGYGSLDGKGRLSKIRLSDMVEIWNKKMDYFSDQADQGLNCQTDGQYVYYHGRGGAVQHCYWQKYDMNGNLILSKEHEQNGNGGYAFHLRNEFLYNYISVAGARKLERRDKNFNLV